MIPYCKRLEIDTEVNNEHYEKPMELEDDE